MSELNSWKCYWAWKGLYFAPRGLIKPCCRFTLDNEHTSSLEEIPPHELPLLNETRKKMSSGQIPSGCQRCAAEEKSQVRSKRMRINENSPAFSSSEDAAIHPEDITHIEWFIGNICNLRCITCSPIHSTGWNADAHAVGYPVHRPEYTDISRLKPYIPSLENLMIIGGEPLIGPQLSEILELIHEAGRADKMELTISTNLSVFPSEKILERLAEFKKVRLEISLDSVGIRNEYIRYPSKWSTQKLHAEKILLWSRLQENIDIVLTSVVSAYSLGGLPELLNWWASLQQAAGVEPKAKHLVLNHLSIPSFQAAQVLPRSVREKISAQFDKNNPYYSTAMNTMDFVLKKDDPESLVQLKKWTLQLDQQRDLSATQVVPEIFQNL